MRYYNLLHSFSSPESSERLNSASGLKALILVIENYLIAVNHRSYGFIHKSKSYDYDVASEMERLCKEVKVHMKNQNFKWKDSTSVFSYWVEYKHAYNYQ